MRRPGLGRQTSEPGSDKTIAHLLHIYSRTPTHKLFTGATHRDNRDRVEYNVNTVLPNSPLTVFTVLWNGGNFRRQQLWTVLYD